MIPSRSWFASSLQERAAWFQNYADQMSAIGAGMGFTVAEIAQVQDDNACIQSLAAIAVELDAYVAAVRQYRITVTEGAVGDATPAFPTPPTTVPTEEPP